MAQNNTSSDIGTESGRAVEATALAATTPQERWRQIIRQQRQSGLTIVDFCQQRSIRTVTFYSWRKKLETPCLPAGATAGRFVPVKLAAGASESAAAAPAGGKLEVRLRGGRRVIVRRGFDRPLLAEVIGVLEGLA